MSNKEIYTKIESEETELRVLSYSNGVFHMSIENWDDYATFDLTKEDAVAMAKSILKELDG